MTNSCPEEEIYQNKKKYFSRNSIQENLYNLLKINFIFRRQEFERTLIKILKNNFSYNLQILSLLEIESDSRKNFLKFIDISFEPKNIIVNELIVERFETSRKIFRLKVDIIEGNALELCFPPNLFNIVFQSPVFTSILNTNFQKELA